MEILQPITKKTLTGRKSYDRKSLTLFCRQIRFADSLTEKDAAKWKLLQNCIFPNNFIHGPALTK